MGRAIAKIEEMQVPKSPKTTFNVGRIGGGTSVNSIPFDGWMEVDMRSSDPASLAAVDANFQKAVDAAVAEENQRWARPGMITVVKELVGDRPAGSTPENSPIVRAGIRGDRARVTANLGKDDDSTPMSIRFRHHHRGGGPRAGSARAVGIVRQTIRGWEPARDARNDRAGAALSAHAHVMANG